MQQFYQFNGDVIFEQIIEQLKCNGNECRFLKLEEFTSIEEIQDQRDEVCRTASLYSLYLLKLLIDILVTERRDVNFYGQTESDLISEKHKSLLISCIRETSHWGLQQYLHESFYRGCGQIFIRVSTNDVNLQINRLKLLFWIEGFGSFLYIRQLHIGNALEQPLLHFIAAIVTLFIINENEGQKIPAPDPSGLMTHLNCCLQKIWLNLSKSTYFRNLMLLKSNIHLPNSGQKMLHRQLLLRLWSPGGFVSLLAALIETNEEKNINGQDQHEEQPQKHIPSLLEKKDIVTKIVVQSSYSSKAQQSLMKQILTFLTNCLNNSDMSEHYMGIAILCLRKYYDLSDDCSQFVREWLFTEFKPLIKPDTTALIVMEWSKFHDHINLLFQLFTVSSVECLPTEILVPYLNLLLQLSLKLLQHSPQGDVLKQQLDSLIVKCLHNRRSEELQQIIENWIWNKYPKNWHCLHKSIQFSPNRLLAQELRITLESTTSKITLNLDNDVSNNKVPFLEEEQPLSAIVTILKNTNYHLLTFEIFKILFRIMPKVTTNILKQSDGSTNDAFSTNTGDSLFTPEEMHEIMIHKLCEHYHGRLQLLSSLECLIQFEPIKPLINENINNFLQILQEMLIMFKNKSETLDESRSSMLLLILVVIREIIEDCTLEVVDKIRQSLQQPLQTIRDNLTDSDVRNQILSILAILQPGHGERPNRGYQPERNRFEAARSLIESKESYQQVEGLECLMKLIRQRDAYTLGNRHVIMALAFETLKSPESYTFLNCVRLFAALVNVYESEVLEMLNDEYTNESASMDYRLVIGEAVLKTGQELGN